MNYNSIPFNVALIDSLTLFFELEKIEVVDYKLITPYAIFYDETSEIIDELNPPKAIFSDLNGIKFRTSRVVRTHPKTKISTEFISIMISTKMLRERYFEGINIDNIDLIVNYINEQKVIKITKQNILDAQFNDIDLCINYKLDFNSYKSSLFMLESMVKLSKRHLVQLYPRQENLRISENFGLLFNKRENACIGSPFVKFYNKTHELLNNSVEFYMNYIYPQLKYGLNINDIVRKEITIKNGKHKTSLFKKNLIKSVEKLQTLNDLFQLTQIELDMICNYQLKYYYEKKQFHCRHDLSPTDKILSYQMFELVNMGKSKLQIYEPLNLIDCKVARSRMKKKMDELMNYAFDYDLDYFNKKLEENSIANQFIKMQDIW